MKLSQKSIEVLRIVINGDGSEKINPPYRTAGQIYEFFEEFDVELDPGSRWAVTQSGLNRLNGTDNISKVIMKVLHPANFIDNEEPIGPTIEYLNKYLDYDGYKIKLSGRNVIIAETSDNSIPLDVKSLESLQSNDLSGWLSDHSQKCTDKIATGDYAGAITNARSMLEELFKWILENTEGGYDSKFDGDLMGLAKEVMKRFDIDPKKVSQPLKQMISGLHSIIQGLAELRNAASDSHGTNYRPGRRHAQLAVNSAHTIASYFIELTADKDIVDKDIAEEMAEYYADMAAQHELDIMRGK